MDMDEWSASGDEAQSWYYFKLEGKQAVRESVVHRESKDLHRTSKDYTMIRILDTF